MTKRKLLKTIGTSIVAVMLLGTTAYAAEHSYGTWTLEVSQFKCTGIYEKTSSNSSGYVSRTKPDPTSTSIGACFVNKNNTIKSASVQIKGIGHKYASYAGYNVDSGDFLALNVWNPTSANQGHSISVAGKFEL